MTDFVPDHVPELALDPAPDPASDLAVLLIGGRSGVGKTTVAEEVSVLLRAADVAHCVIEGDVLDQVHPAPPGDPHRTGITRRNLAALWANYAALGHRRLIYTNTVSILEPDMIVSALSQAAGAAAPPAVQLTGVLLTASDDTVAPRLGRREQGSQLALHLRRSVAAAARLEERAPAGTMRVRTDRRSVRDIATEVTAATGWCSAPHS